MAIDPSPNLPALRDRFLAGLSAAAATVDVVTTDGPAGRFGVTVSAMSSVSAGGGWPTLPVCVHHAGAAAPAILSNGVFRVRVLREDQSAVSDCSAGRVTAADGGRLSRAGWLPQASGVPWVAGALVALDGRLASATRVGTRHAFVGAAQDLHLDRPGSPLPDANRACGRLAASAH